MKSLKYPILLMIYFSVATIAAETAAIGMLWAKGALDQERIFRLLAIAHDVDLQANRRKLESRVLPIHNEQLSFAEVQTARTYASLDLDLRETAADKGLMDIRELSDEFNLEWSQYRELKDRFDLRLKQIRQGAVDQSLKDVQRQLESVHPRLAKDQILRILDDTKVDPDASTQFVVTIFKAMPSDKRKRIAAEFKDSDSEKLHEIIRHVRLGVPDVELFRNTRRQLQRFEAQP